MNRYGEPAVPPRRKRSLSASRFDSQPDDNFGFGFPNRMKHNFSTDQLSALYINNVPKFASQATPNNQYRLSSVSMFPSAKAGQAGVHAMNPYPMQSSQYSMQKVPVRPHHDYLKYGQGVNVSYNPYQKSFNPTLMARPSLEPYQSIAISTSIANAIARGRDPTLYSSKEQLNYAESTTLSDSNKNLHYLSKIPPERPPPPKLDCRQSMENLSSMSTNKMIGRGYNRAEHGSRSELRDRRSLSPTRFAEQRPYATRRSTSPMPNLSSPNSPQLSRSPSGTQLYLPSSYSYSREPSPLTSRSPSPLRTSHFNYPNMTAGMYTASSSSRPGSVTSKLISRSSILGGSAGSGATGLSPSTHDMSLNHCARSAPRGSYLDPNRPSMVNSNMDRVDGYQQQRFTPGTGMEGQMSILGAPEAHHANSGNFASGAAHFKVSHDPHFSESFTDHCDQYKSITSKILSKKSNRNSGDFSDFDGKEGMQELCLDMADARKLSGSSTHSAQTAGNNELEGSKLVMVANSFMEPVKPGYEKINEMVAEPSTVATLPLSPPPQTMRRSSSNSGLANYQRKASLPTDYMAANGNALKLSEEWSREKVATMAHEARLRLKNPPNTTRGTLKKLGVWFTRQFAFLLICILNILIAYMFYNLLSILPNDENVPHK